MTNQPHTVDIREVAPRDGLQIEPPVPTDTKIGLIDKLAATGVQRIEATSFVSRTAVPALADAEDVAAQLHRWPGIQFSALVAGEGGTHRAIDAGLARLEYVLSASDGHSLANVGRTSDESVERIAPIAELIHEVSGSLEVIIAIAFDCPYDGPTSIERVTQIAGQAVAAGADSLSIADTIGTATPVRVARTLDAVRRAAPTADVGIHLHDTRGQGLANAWEAYRHGVRRFDASIGGLGGCPYAPGASGNIATEELVYMFEGGGVRTGIEIDACFTAARTASDALNKTLPSNLLAADG